MEATTTKPAKAKAAAVNPAEALKSGIKYLTLQKKRSKHSITLNDGVVVQTSQAQMMGWSHTKVLDWADRCGVQVFSSDDQRKLGERVPTMPEQTVAKA